MKEDINDTLRNGGPEAVRAHRQGQEPQRKRNRKRKPVLELCFGHTATTPQPMGTIVAGILYAGSLTLFYGPPKSGKSFLVTDLFITLTLPELDHWMGHTIVRHGPVLYVACEGHTGFWKRLSAAEIDRNITLPDDFVLAIGRPHLIKIDPKSHAAVPHPDDVINAVKRATEAGHAPIAVAIDTVFRSLGAGNVSASDHMNAYLAALAAITDQGIAVAAIHHETKAGGTPAGSVTMIGGADTLIHTEKRDDGSYNWIVEMAKDDCETQARDCTLEVIDVGVDCEGQPQTSCVVRSAKPPPGPFADIDYATLTIDAGLPDGERYSDDGPATTRAAWKIVQKYAPAKPEDQCRKIIAKWIKNGVLARQKYESEKDRKERSGLKVNNAMRPGTRL